MISRAVYTAIQTLNNNMAKNFITKLVKEDNVEGLKAKTKELSDLEVHVGQDWLTQCQYKVTGWGIMFICGMVFWCAGTLSLDQLQQI